MVNPNNGKEPQLGGEFKDQVDISADAVEGKAKYGLTESTENAAAASSLTITNTRTISIMGVDYTFQFNESMEDIYKAVVQYYEVNRDIEAFRGISKAQGLVKLLSLPTDQFNNTFNGLFDINATSFVASKNYVLEYATKLREASDPSSYGEQFQTMMSNFSNAIANAIIDVARATNGNIDALTRAWARNSDAVFSCVDAERVERIARQKMLGERIDVLERKIEALNLEMRERANISL